MIVTTWPMNPHLMLKTLLLVLVVVNAWSVWIVLRLRRDMNAIEKVLKEILRIMGVEPDAKR